MASTSALQQLLCSGFVCRNSEPLSFQISYSTRSRGLVKISSSSSSSLPKALTSAIEVGDSLGQALFSAVPESDLTVPVRTANKVTVVGVGNVGMACAQTILTQGLVSELALVDIQPDKLRGEMLDLQHAAAFLPHARIVASTDYAVTAGSDICVVTAGARQREGESRLDLVDRNVSLFRHIIPSLVAYSPHTMLLIVSNPVDILTYASWKLSGGLPPNKVIGTGTNLDSSRFRALIADRLNSNAQNVHGYIVGEHGDSSVPLWSSISVGGVQLLGLLDRRGIRYDKSALAEIHHAVVQSAYEVIRLKGYTSWAIGYSVATLVKSMLRDQRRIHPVSVLAKGYHGIEHEVYLSLPATLGRAGVVNVTNAPLTEDEVGQLQTSAKTIWEIQNQLQIL